MLDGSGDDGCDEDKTRNMRSCYYGLAIMINYPWIKKMVHLGINKNEIKSS